MYRFSQLTRERNNVFYSIYFSGDAENCLQSQFQKPNCGLTSSSVVTTTNAGAGDGFRAHELCRENLPPCRGWVGRVMVGLVVNCIGGI